MDLEQLKKLQEIGESLEPAEGGNGTTNLSEANLEVLIRLIKSGRITAERAAQLPGVPEGIEPILIQAVADDVVPTEVVKELIDTSNDESSSADGPPSPERQKLLVKIYETNTLPPDLQGVPPDIISESNFFSGAPSVLNKLLELAMKDQQSEQTTRKSKQNTLLPENNRDNVKASKLASVKSAILRRVKKTRTLPPKLRKVPRKVLKETGIFDTLAKDLQTELGLINTVESKSEEQLIPTNKQPSAIRRIGYDHSRNIGRKRPKCKHFLKNVFLDKLNPRRILQSAKTAATNTRNIVTNILYTQYNRMRRLGMSGYKNLRRIMKPKPPRKSRLGILSFLSLSKFKLPPLIEITSPDSAIKPIQKHAHGNKRREARPKYPPYQRGLPHYPHTGLPYKSINSRLHQEGLFNFNHHRKRRHASDDGNKSSKEM